MKIVLEVEELDEVVRSVEIELGDDETVEAAAKRFATALNNLEFEELLEDLTVGEIQLERGQRIGAYAHHGNRWRHRRACIDLHFEADEMRHHFPVQSLWSRVHRWGCEQFHVDHTLCANLELREGGPKGPVLNENLPVGCFHGCKVVWLVKPGPEPYGQQ